MISCRARLSLGPPAVNVGLAILLNSRSSSRWSRWVRTIRTSTEEASRNARRAGPGVGLAVLRRQGLFARRRIRLISKSSPRPQPLCLQHAPRHDSTQTSGRGQQDGRLPTTRSPRTRESRHRRTRICSATDPAVALRASPGSADSARGDVRRAKEHDGFDDIDFESAEFSNGFRQEPRQAVAYDVVHPQMMEFLLASDGRSSTFSRGDAVSPTGIARGCRTSSNQREFARRFFDLWPGHLTSTLKST